MSTTGLAITAHSSRELRTHLENGYRWIYYDFKEDVNNDRVFFSEAEAVAYANVLVPVWNKQHALERFDEHSQVVVELDVRIEDLESMGE